MRVDQIFAYENLNYMYRVKYKYSLESNIVYLDAGTNIIRRIDLFPNQYLQIGKINYLSESSVSRAQRAVR